MERRPTFCQSRVSADKSRSPPKCELHLRLLAVSNNGGLFTLAGFFCCSSDQWAAMEPGLFLLRLKVFILIKRAGVPIYRMIEC